MTGAGPWSPPIASTAIFMCVNGPRIESEESVETPCRLGWPERPRMTWRRIVITVGQLYPNHVGKKNSARILDDDGLAFVGSAVHARIVRQFQFMTLRAERKILENQPHLRCSPAYPAGIVNVYVLDLPLTTPSTGT